MSGKGRASVGGRAAIPLDVGRFDCGGACLGIGPCSHAFAEPGGHHPAQTGKDAPAGFPESRWGMAPPYREARRFELPWDFVFAMSL